MKKVTTIFKAFGLTALISCFLWQGNLAAQVFDMDTIVRNGSHEKYINFLYMGDGYTAGQQSKYISDLHSINDGFFNKVPFKNYKNFFNVFAIKVISPESGIKHPRTASDCPSASDFGVSNPNNYFGTTFDYGGIHRLVVPTNYTLVNSVAADNFPEYDQILIIGNTEQYGGSGGTFATGTTHSSSVDLMLHECGHSFSGLADEYWAGDSYAGEKYNMTHSSNANPDDVRWKSWLGVSGVDIYQHCCGGSSASWYKPHENCEMEFLNREFCAVCKQRTIEKIYELANPIVSYAPSTGTVHMIAPMEFKFTKLMLPEPNTLKIQWILNGEPVGGNTENFWVEMEMLEIGVNTLEAVVTDTTKLLRVAPTFTHHINKVSWKLNKWATGIDIESDQQHMSVNVFPNPASDFIKIKAKGIENRDKVATFQIVNINGQVIKEQKSSVYNSETELIIQLGDVPAGNYFLQMHTSKGMEQFKIAVIH